MKTLPKTALPQAVIHFRAFCKALNIDVDSDDTRDTPLRVAKMFAGEFTAGQRPMPFKFTTFDAKPDEESQLVSVTGIRFTSLCRHHLLPITGYAHVAYLPGRKIAGLSKLPRLVQWHAAQPSVQEDLTGSLLNELVLRLDPRFAAVTMIATHACMACRGVKDYESRTTTSKFYHKADGDYTATHQEFLRSVDLWYHSRGVL